jgi:hypothetical protein
MLRSSEWKFEARQVPSWTPEGELSFVIDETMPPRRQGGRTYRVEGQLLVPGSALPSALRSAVANTVVEEAQQRITDAGLFGALEIGARALGELAKGISQFTSGGGRGDDLAEAGYIRIVLLVGDGNTKWPGEGYLRLSPYPLKGNVQAVLRLLPQPHSI